MRTCGCLHAQGVATPKSGLPTPIAPVSASCRVRPIAQGRKSLISSTETLSAVVRGTFMNRRFAPPSAGRDLRSTGSRPSALTTSGAIDLTDWQQGREAEPAIATPMPGGRRYAERPVLPVLHLYERSMPDRWKWTVTDVCDIGCDGSTGPARRFEVLGPRCSSIAAMVLAADGSTGLSVQRPVAPR
jgi:hypothetical protein